MITRKSYVYISIVILLMLLVSSCLHINAELKETINNIESDYQGLIRINASKESIIVFVDKYFETNEYDKVTEVLFTPDDCIMIMNEFVEHCDMSGINLSFEFPNGTRIAFSDYFDERYTTVEIDNSRAFGAIIPNIAYYSSYTGFDNYYIYGVFNDHSRFGDTVSIDEIDRSFLKYIAYNAKVYMDKHTSLLDYRFAISMNELLNSECYSIPFLQLLYSLNENADVNILADSDERTYNTYEILMQSEFSCPIVDEETGVWDIATNYEIPDTMSYRINNFWGIKRH